MKKLSSEYKFEMQYNNGEKKGKVEVLLNINYEQETFSITPSTLDFSNNKENNAFYFLNGNKEKSYMWRAVALAVDHAVEFAHKELVTL